MMRCVLLFMLFCACGASHAAMVSRPIDYQDGEVKLTGTLIFDDASHQARPALLMVPNWYGINEAAIKKAEQIAGHDYVIFLADMYGSGVRPSNAEQASKAVGPFYQDRSRMRARVEAGLRALRGHIQDAPIDPARVAAIGFCFGGSAVLDLARSGADVAAVVSFHGGLSTDDPALAKQIKAAVLVLNGADDQGTAKDAEAFRAEMRSSAVDWSFVDFGHAVHCFTEVGENSPGCRYDAKVAARADRLMREWLDEAFAGHAD
jgi:dienelactone hydrolase